MGAQVLNRLILNFLTTLYLTYYLYPKAAQLLSTTDKVKKEGLVQASKRTNAIAQPSFKINGSVKKNRYAKSLSATLLVWWRVRSRLRIVLIKSNLKLNSPLTINSKTKVVLRARPETTIMEAVTTTQCSLAPCKLKRLNRWPRAN